MNSADLPGLRALLVVAMAGAWVSSAAGPASARSCDELTGLVTVTSGRTEVVLALPRQLEGRPLRPAAVTVTQGGDDVPVRAVERSSPALMDVVVVLDASARLGPVEEEGKRAARTLLSALPPAVSAAVVATGRSPVVVRALRPGPRDAVAALAGLTPGGRAALNDAMILAVQQFPADPVRQQHVVVLAAGPDAASGQGWDSVQSLLQRRGVSLDVIDLTSARSVPDAGPQCPVRRESGGGVAGSAASAEEAAAKVAASILDRRRVILPELDPAPPLLVTVEIGGVSRSTTLARRGDPAADSVGLRRTRHAAVGSEALVLALLLGLVAISVFLVLILWRTERGKISRRAAGAVLAAGWQRVGERGVPDEARRIPRAEGRRRLADAWHDLDAVMADGPSARAVAEQEAYL
ncbi:MAG: VWA domain-containing protein, partial [Sporichthyaceae bacterium]|nr:VWA domain-containing protein [Sporichthyaceae bacterium]